MSYTSFEKRWLGKRIDYDKVYEFQCVDLVKQYLYQEFRLNPGSWGNAIDYWTRTHPKILTKFKRVQTNAPKRGDVVILRGVPGRNSAKYGHIGIATGRATPTTVEILEQNGSTGNGSGEGGDAIRKRFVPRTRIAGVLRPKLTAKVVAAVKNVVKKQPVYLRVRSGEGLSGLAKRAGYKDYSKPARWTAIAKLNGSGDWRRYNSKLQPNQKVRVK